MFSVTHRAKAVKQPRGGYVPKSLFKETQYYDNCTIIPINPSEAPMQGSVVDYLTRYMISGDKSSAFDIPMAGAVLLDTIYGGKGEIKHFRELLKSINGLNEKSVIAACRIVGYETIYRAGIKTYVDVDKINPSLSVVQNIIVMVNRSLNYLAKVGPVVKSGFTFDNAYTDLVSSGDGDYLTEKMIIDLKVSQQSFSSKWSLQLLMYYILSVHCSQYYYAGINSICIYNPYTNKSYIASVDDISDEIKYIVSHDVIGYKMQPRNGFVFDNDILEPDYSQWRNVYGTDNDYVDKIFDNLVFTSFNVSDYSDGIHRISINDYWTYLCDVEPEKKDDFMPLFPYTRYVLMLKKSGYIMFFSVSETGKLSIFQGAKRRKASYPIQYYYDHIEDYTNAVKLRLSNHWNALNHISNQIKALYPSETFFKNLYPAYCRYHRINGEADIMDYDQWVAKYKKYYMPDISASGRIHGCIVDIDYYNHIYLNPYDGTIVPYYATSMYNKEVYKNTASLIATKRNELLESLLKLPSVSSDDSLPAQSSSMPNMLINPNDEIDKTSVTVTEHDMYNISNRLKPLQLIFSHSLVQVWYDSILEDAMPSLVDSLTSYNGKRITQHSPRRPASSRYIEHAQTSKCNFNTKANQHKNHESINSHTHINSDQDAIQIKSDNKPLWSKSIPQADGHLASLIQFRRVDDIDVQFEDGTIIHHTQFREWKAGALRHPSPYKRKR